MARILVIDDEQSVRAAIAQVLQKSHTLMLAGDGREAIMQHQNQPADLIITDDNFARKKLWRETFLELIKLREEGIQITFMMQVDLARKPKDFVNLAAKAGCTQVFIGMESGSRG